jgi:hypothetical protein
MALSPLEIIKRQAQKVVESGRNFLNAPDNSTAGIVRNTITGLPTAGVKGAFNTYKDTTKQVGNITKEIGQGSARGLGTLGTFVGNLPQGKVDSRIQISQDPRTKRAQEFLYGKEYVNREKPISFKSEGQDFLSLFGKGKEGTFSGKYVAPIIGATFPLLDAIPGGRGAKTLLSRFADDAIQSLSKTTDSKTILKQLVDAGADIKTATKVAPDIAKITDVAQIKRVLNSVPVQTIKATDSVVKTLAKTDNVDDVKTQLRKIKVPESQIDNYAEIIAKTTDTKRVGDILNTARFEAPRPRVDNDIQKAKASGQSFDEWVKGKEIEESFDLTPGVTRISNLDETGLYHGAGSTNLKSILRDGELKVSVSKLDDVGEKVVSLTGNKSVANSYGAIFELDTNIPKRQAPNKAVKGDNFPGFEYRSDKNIPLEKVKSITISINKKEGLDTKIMWDYSSKNPEYISARELKNKFEERGIPVYINDGTNFSRSQLKAEWDKINLPDEAKSLQQTADSLPESVLKSDVPKAIVSDELPEGIIKPRRKGAESILDEMTDPNSFPLQKAEINKIFKETNLVEKLPTYKDIGNIRKNFQDVYRIFEKVFDPATYKVIKRKILDPFDASKGKYVDMMNSYADDLQKTIVQKLKIKRGSKESKFLMRYGEGNATYEQVVKELGKNQADNIVEADKWFRKAYDELLDQVNASRIAIYPDNPTKIIPKRKDYYRHFQEMNDGFKELRNIFENTAGIDPKLAGISPFTKPKSKWMSAAQQRLGLLKSTEDAVGGFLDYLPSAGYAIHIDQHIGSFRALAQKIRQTTKSKNTNNFIEFVEKFANSLAGKTNDIDRLITENIPGGRKALEALNFANKRIKKNTLLMNASSSLAQIFNVPQGIASAKKYSANGLVRTFGSIFSPNKPMKQSSFLKERYFKAFNKFDKGIIKNTEKFAGWMMSALDEVGTKFIWNSHYEKAIAEGIKNPVKYADDITRQMVAGRGIGEVPLIQQSKVFQLVAPFQLEVANLWSVLGKMVSNKDAAGLITLFVTSYIMNRVAEKVRGTPVSFDPIQASIEAYSAFKEGDSPGEGFLMAAGRLGGETLSSLPLGQTLASIYPEYGGDFLFFNNVPTREEMFGTNDPTRYGSPLLLDKGFKDPLFRLLPPFGGSQLKKTIEGVKALNQGGSFDRGNNLQFTTPDKLPGVLQTLAFGKFATKEARDFFNKNSEKRRNKASVQPVYDSVQKLKSEGKLDEAKNIVDALSEDEWKIYKQIKSTDTRETTLQTKKDVLPTYRQVQKLKEQGKTDEAKAIVDSLSAEEWKAYKLIRDQLNK